MLETDVEFMFSSCPRCKLIEREKHAEKQRHEADLQANRAALQASREANEAAERRHRDQMQAAAEQRAFIAEQERERQDAEDEREAERQRHAEHIEAERKANQERLEAERRSHQEDLAERQRRVMHYQTLRQSRFGKARDDLDIAIAQRPYDSKVAEAALRSAIEHWPGYAWAWLELAELLQEQGAKAEQEIERAFTSAMAEGVWKLAPERVPQDLVDFGKKLAGASSLKMQGVPARQGWFLARFVALASAGRIGKLLDGSPAFYPMLPGLPDAWIDPDRGAPIAAQDSGIAAVDDLAVLFLASRSVEALERLVAFAATSERVRASIGAGCILGAWGDDTTFFGWCASLDRERFALRWLSIALEVRLPEPAVDVDALFSELVATKLKYEGLDELAAKGDAKEALEGWTSGLTAHFKNRERRLQALKTAVPASFTAVHKEIAARSERERVAKTTASDRARVWVEGWEATQRKAADDRRDAELARIAAAPSNAKPIRPPADSFPDEVLRYLRWRANIDKTIEAYETELMRKVGDTEIDQAFVAKQTEELRRSIELTRPLIDEEINRSIESQRSRVEAVLVDAVVPGARLCFLMGAVWFGTSGAIVSLIVPSAMPFAIVIALAGAIGVSMVLPARRRGAARVAMAPDVTRELDALRRQFRAEMGTTNKKAKKILDTLGVSDVIDKQSTPDGAVAEKVAHRRSTVVKSGPEGWITVGFAVVGMIALVIHVQSSPRNASSGAIATDATSASSAVPPHTRCPSGMVRVQGGTFMMGSPDGQGQADEHPQHRVTLSTFCIDRTEASVGAYQRCVAAGQCDTAPTTIDWPGITAGEAREHSSFCMGNHLDQVDNPINCIDWRQAKRFCEWSGHPEGARRLPREAEWEYAARGEAGRTYPWGDEAPDGTRANLCGVECAAYMRTFRLSGPNISRWRDAHGGLAPVESYLAGATPGPTPAERILNLAGNVWEWVEDPYQADAYQHHNAEGSLAREATGSSRETEYRVLRGDGWKFFVPAVARPAFRYGSAPTFRSYFVGVRCARGTT